MYLGVVCPRGSRASLWVSCRFIPPRGGAPTRGEEVEDLLIVPPRSGSTICPPDDGPELDPDEEELDTGGPNGDDVDVGLTNIDFVPSTNRPPRGGSSSDGRANVIWWGPAEEGPAPGDCGGNDCLANV